MNRMISEKTLRAWSPLVVLTAAVAAFCFSLTVYTIETPSAPLVSRIFAALDLFTGSYIPLRLQSAAPSPLLAGAGISALLVTFLAALTALYELSTKARQWLQARRSGASLIVIGSGEAAADLLRVHPNPTGKDLLLITGEEIGQASVTADGIAPRIVADLDAFSTTPRLLDLTRRTKRVAVATADDGLNLVIAEAIARQAIPGQKVMALVADPRLADERRPSVIDGDLPDRFGISCPTENVAEEVCHQIDLLILANQEMERTDGVVVDLDLDDSDLAHTVALWVQRHSWSRRCMLSETSQQPLPRWNLVDMRRRSLTDDPAIAKLPRVHVVAWANPVVSATKALETLRRERADPNAKPASYIVVTTRQLLGENVTGNSRIAVVDPKVAAWDDALFFDDIEDQWGHAFHQAYIAIWGENLNWSEVRHAREGQSSRLAALNMLAVLHEHGYQLVKTLSTAAPIDPLFGDDQVRAMAQLEHEDWRKRTFVEDDRYVHSDENPKRVAAGRELDHPWAELLEKDQDMNLRLIRHTYPGMAALFGYQIQASASSSS